MPAKLGERNCNLHVVDVKWCECTWRKMDENWWWNIKHTYQSIRYILLEVNSYSSYYLDPLVTILSTEDKCKSAMRSWKSAITQSSNVGFVLNMFGTRWFGSSGMSQIRNHTTIKGCRIQFTIGLRYCWWKKSAPVLRLLGSFSSIYLQGFSTIPGG